MANLSLAQTILAFFTDALNFDFSEIMVLYVMDTYSVFQAQKLNFGLGNYAGQILDPAGNCRVWNPASKIANPVGQKVYNMGHYIVGNPASQIVNPASNFRVGNSRQVINLARYFRAAV